jgi:hypothetical protein
MAKKPKLSDESQTLAFFLINLALNKSKREAFEKNPKAAMEEAGLSEKSMKAIRSGNQADLADQLASLQSTGGGAPVDAAKSVKKTVAKKGAKKKAPKKK